MKASASRDWHPQSARACMSTSGRPCPSFAPVASGEWRAKTASMRLVKGESLKEAIERFHAAGGRRRRRPAAVEPRAAAAPEPVRGGVQRGRLCPQPRRDPPRPEAGQHHARPLRRDAGGGLGAGQGRRPAARRPRPAGAVEATLQPASGSGSSETLPGTALGTPAYMSPEQAEGRLEQVGPLSDVYSLGATLYCLLTGKPPIDETDVGAALRRVQRGEFPPPRAANLRVPRALEAICLKAMALRPEERYASPRALADDLERWLADEPVAVLSRAVDHAPDAVGAAAQDGGGRDRGAPGHGGGRPGDQHRPDRLEQARTQQQFQRAEATRPRQASRREGSERKGRELSERLRQPD